MSATSYVRTIFTSYGFNIKSFMYAPTVYKGENNNQFTVSHHPVLLFQYDLKGKDKNDHPDPTFKMSQKYQLRVTRFFTEIFNWFNFKDLFIIDEESGKLIMNLDYKNLYAKVRTSYTDGHIMYAVPAVCTIDSKSYPGTLLYINSTRNPVLLKEEDIENICGIISTFNFQQETLLMMYLGNHPNLWRDIKEMGPGKNPFL